MYTPANILNISLLSCRIFELPKIAFLLKEKHFVTLSGIRYIEYMHGRLDGRRWNEVLRMYISISGISWTAKKNWSTYKVHTWVDLIFCDEIWRIRRWKINVPRFYPINEFSTFSSFSKTFFFFGKAKNIFLSRWFLLFDDFACVKSKNVQEVFITNTTSSVTT